MQRINNLLVYNMEKNDPAACDKARRDSMNEVISFLREWDIS